MSTWTLTPAEFTATAARVAKINERAAKKGWTGRLTLEGQQVVREVRANGMVQQQVVVEATLSGEAPSYEGWQFLAAVDTVGEGFVLRVAPGVGETGVDRSTLEAGRCEHCGTARNRKKTYLVREEATGRTLQVGSTCIKDFLGWEGRFVFLDAEGVVREVEAGGFTHAEPSWTVEFVLAVAAAVVATYGYVRVGDWNARSTRDAVSTYLCDNGKAGQAIRDEVGEPDYAKGLEVGEVLMARLEGSSDYVQNLRTALAADLVGPRQLGLVASALAAYARLTEADAKAKAAEKVGVVNGWVGKEGEKVTVTGTITKAMKVTSDWGTSVLVLVQTDKGLVKMFTSAAWAWEVKEGEEITLAGKIKALDTYQGVKQTVLTRPAKR